MPLPSFFLDVCCPLEGSPVLKRRRLSTGFTPAVYGLGSGIFFLAYTLFEVPSNLLLARFGGPTWLSRILVRWLCQATMPFFSISTNELSVLAADKLGVRRGVRLSDQECNVRARPSILPAGPTPLFAVSPAEVHGSLCASAQFVFLFLHQPPTPAQPSRPLAACPAPPIPQWVLHPPPRPGHGGGGVLSRRVYVPQRLDHRR